ncbi:MAG: phage portal protein [Brooklawnia sp.]|nr:phage portal protein [Brooklawnia sp.]
MPGTALTSDERLLVSRLRAKAGRQRKDLLRLERYRDGAQHLRMMGLTVPPELRGFETVINVPGMAVREPVMRQELRGFQRSASGSTGAVDQGLQDAWDFNNMASQSIRAHMFARTFGRAFVCVGWDDDTAESPTISVESPVDFAVDADVVHRKITAALKTYRDGQSVNGVLYLPDETVWIEAGPSGWQAADRYRHGLGAVPVVSLVNRGWADPVCGQTEMNDVIDMTDAIARMITNMQMAGEFLALPHRWASGIDPSEFFDENGNETPVWESYLTILRATKSENAKFGSFDVAELDNFNKAVNNMLSWCAAMLGLPTRFMGQQTVNPASEGAIVADEVRLVRNVELMNRSDGDSWAWVMQLYERLQTGEWPQRNSIRALWHNPATPTYSQRADAIVKMMSGNIPVLSREGAWDELGWTEERKQREREYFAAQQTDPLVQLAADVMSGTTNAASGN